MIRKYLILAAGISFLVSFSALNAYAWDTAVKLKGVGTDWRSIYESIAYNHGGKVLIHGNEHAELSAMAIMDIGAGKLLIDTNEPHLVVDINASYFHRNLSGETFAPNDAPDDGLERRLLPPPSQFAGIPDFSYSIYDWINKNELCPAVPPGADGIDQCHAFSGWLGAGLNASHFGTQAKLNYQHLHRLALSIAKLTRSIRVKLEKKPEVLDAYRKFIREGEWMALAYEGYASHFMADRWSTGHMWERWNAGDYDHLANKKLFPNKMIGIVSGFIHGWEPVLHGRILVAGRGVSHHLFPAPLSAPWIETKGKRNILTRSWRWWAKGEAPQFSLTKMEPSLWRHESKDGLKYGVGDDVLAAMYSGRFGKQYGLTNSLPLNVPTQRIEMMECLEAGWADTIRALGKNKKGSYGIENIPLNNDAPSLSNLKHNCFDQFVSNQSIARAWPFTQPTFWSKLGHSMLTVSNNSYVRKAFNYAYPNASKLAGKYLKKTNQVGKTLVRISARIWSANKQHANGIELATGGIGDIIVKALPPARGNEVMIDQLVKNTASPGSTYGAANYLPPEDISALPDKDSQAWRARDRETIYGFFSKAGAHHWCEQLPKLLPKLRGSKNRQDQAVCRYLSDLTYQGTDTDYTGKKTEKRTATNKAEGTPIPSYCQALGIKLDDSNVPVHLLPGYVSEPYGRTKHDLTYASIGAWCAKVPVLEYIRDKNGEMRDETVAKVKTWDDPIILKGEDLGIHKGKLWIDCNQSGGIRVPDDKIQNWNDGKIKFDLSWMTEEKRKAETHSICVEAKDGMKSVGHFEIHSDVIKISISGKITSDTGDFVSGAAATIEIGDKRYTGKSDSDGGYQIFIPKSINIPISLIVIADKKDYNTGSTVVGKDDFKHADIRLSKSSKDVIQIDKSLHHLGDSHYGGDINSQFQKPKAEGTSLTKSFKIQASRFKAGMVIAGAELTMTAKGLQEQNPVLINGKKIGVLATSNSDGSATRLRLSVGSCVLQNGKNELTIKTADSNQNDDLDDFEFANIQLKFKPIKDMSPDDKRFTKLSSVRAMDAGFGGIIKKIVATGQFAIAAKGKGECKTLKDIAIANVYRKGKRDDSSVTARLVETGADSGVFHSDNATSVKSVGAEPGEKIVIRSGIRGTSLLVTGRKLKLEGIWESQDAGNQYQMRVSYVESDNKYVGELSKQGKKSKDVGFSIGDRVWTARPGDNWTFVTATQDWRRGKRGITESKELKVTELNLSRSNDDKLILEDGRVFVRVKGQANTGVKAQQAATADHHKQAKARKELEASKAELNDLKRQWKQLSDYIDEQRAKGNSVDDLLPNLRKLTDKIKKKRARVMRLKKQTGVETHIGTPTHPAPTHAKSINSKRSGAFMHTSQPKKGVKQTVTQPGTISMHGGSRQLHAGIPAKGKSTGQAKPTKPVKWTVYKLVVKAHGSRLPTMDVLKLSFQKGAKRAAFRVMRYPVSLERNDQTGKIIWSINSAGDVVENQMAIQKDMIDSLEIMANDKKKGGVAKAALAGMINRRLGPDAEQKK